MLLHAQFQEPTSEELKMTADPKAPGAAAVYLNREESTDDGLHFHSLYERIKVLTEKGKELATVRVPYEHGADKVTDVEGRTIHADGTVIPLTTKPSDLVDYKTKNFQVNTMVFTLPSVEVGSILEYRLKVRYADGVVSSPTWNIQQPYFVHKAHYLFHTDPRPGMVITDSQGTTLTDLMYSWRIDSDAKIVHDQKNNYTLDVTDVPPIPDDDWMPPLNTFKWRVEFYYTHFTTGPAFWTDAGKKWSGFVREFTNPTGTLKKAAGEMVAATDTETQKAEKIYAAVMKLENTDFTRHKSEAERKKEKLKEIHRAEDVWKQQSGDSDELALLYVALARAAGLNVSPMKIVNRNRALFDESYLSSGQLDDYIAVAQLDGKQVILDPGEKMCPFGMLHWKHTVAMGFRLNDKESVVGRTPSATYKDSSVQRVADLTVDPSGAVSGVIRLILTGQEALHWRQISLENDEEEVKKRFNESMKEILPDGVQADFDHFLALNDYPANLIGIVKVSGSLGAATGKHFFIPGLFFQSHAKHPFVAQEKRIIPIDVHYPKMEQDDVTYHLPAGYTVDSKPAGAGNSWEGHALFKIAFAVNPDSVSVVRTLAYNYTILDPKDYASLHDFYQKVATADQ